jgi:hypothetical protein
MQKSQQSWVLSQYPPTQWNLRGGADEYSVKYSTVHRRKKFKKKSLLTSFILSEMVQLLIAIVLVSTMVASLPFDDDDNSDFTVDYDLPDFLTVSSSILGNLTRPGVVSASLISTSSSEGLQADLVKGIYYLTQFGYIQPSNSSALRQAKLVIRLFLLLERKSQASSQR